MSGAIDWSKWDEIYDNIVPISRVHIDEPHDNPFDRLRESLTNVIDRGEYFTARCPGHDDQANSLQVKRMPNGKVSVQCFAGCEIENILAPINMRTSDLYPPNPTQEPPKPKQVQCTYDYHDANGRLVMQVLRYYPKEFKQRRPDPTKPGGWNYSLTGIERPLYHLADVIKAKAEGRTIYLCEGEKDADNLRDAFHVCATTNAGGISTWSKNHTDTLTGARVVILADNDEPGRKGAARRAEAIPGAVVVHLPGLPDKGDVTDWLAQGGTLDELEALIETGTTAVPRLAPCSFATMAAAHPNLSDPVIDGLLRHGETMNVIAAPKIGKSWLAYDLALSITTGGLWLGVFPCTQGRVLIIDNELHPQTMASRVPKVAEARRVPAGWDSRLDVLSLRGMGLTLDTLAPVVREIESGRYSVIILDAWYRFIPKGLSENSNADVMSLYNLLDQYAAATGAAMVAIHHQSKGGQGEKEVTDVGAGAGAQSRAADTHLVLRQHEEAGCVVLEAAVRSFPPVEPLGLRWEFPLWQPAYNLDTEAVKGRRTRGETQRDEKDRKDTRAILEGLKQKPLTIRELRNIIGSGKPRTEKILDRLEMEGLIAWEMGNINGGMGRIYTLTNTAGVPLVRTPGTYLGTP